MSSPRLTSVESVISRSPIDVSRPSRRISEYYAINVFSETAMRKYLAEEAFLSVMAAINSGGKIDRAIADQVALSMKSWAMDKGATHFTHWFQPLTGATAEKHDTFFIPDGSRGMEHFTGDSLVQQEPDASSFPSGGLRATFEARGYTAWDPSSPAFIMEIGEGRTLCIPTIFISYNGEALDYKAPLLKSCNALEKAAVAVCQYFDRNVRKVTATLGWEQEYFLVDKALFYARPDLLLAGRTLVGHAPAKGQQLADHYFGSIPERIYRYMLDLETEALKLGIPIRTRHNEVAPSQFECAPTFEEVNLAVDHNQLLMDLMDRVARRHNLRALLHEKPYAGINGSGKHNNWSMSTDSGKNLLAPGNTPKTNLQFLTFFINTIKAVHDHDDLLRSSIASAGNDHRLGANEAPPAIISVFIGRQLIEVLDEIEQRARKGKMDEQARIDLKLDIHNRIPDVLLDNTDRNRTSPFAFTGNKFEFRAVGSSMNCAAPMTVLNAIVANQLVVFRTEVDGRIKAGEKKDEAILYVLKSYIKQIRNIFFEGDNYSETWQKEAGRRGLNNVTDTPRALDFFVAPEAQALFLKLGIYNEKEIHARHEIMLETYVKRIQIDARILGEICLTQVIPSSNRYLNRLMETTRGMKDVGLPAKASASQRDIIQKISNHINEIHDQVLSMIDSRKKANQVRDARKRAIAYCDTVKPYFDTIRYHVDKLEMLVDDGEWPLPKYREMLFN